MKNYGITWTDPAGVRRASSVSYDKTSASHRKQRLEDELGKDAADVKIVELKPGERPKV